MVVVSTWSPSCRTICGSRDSTVFSRFWMSTCARSGSVPGANVTTTCATPEVSLDDSKYRMFFTPDRPRSINDTTLSFIATGVAPG